MEVGVIIGRFQIDYLHEGHRSLMTYVKELHENVIVFLGCAPIIGTKRDPLDFPTRKAMVQQVFPDAIVLPLPDNPSNEKWSENVDRMISLCFPKAEHAILYGGRESFIPHYKGRFETKNVDGEIESKFSASERRKKIGEMVPLEPDQRFGVIHAIENYWPAAKPCVDIAMTQKNELGWTVLMGMKDGESLWRFPGGMVDPTDKSYEDAAARELVEEAGMIGASGPKSFKYVCSRFVDDWRFRKVQETKIITAFYQVDYFSGRPIAGDDLATVSWVPLDTPNEKIMVNHRDLMDDLRNFMKEKK